MKNQLSSRMAPVFVGIIPAFFVGAAIMLVHGAPWSMPLLNLGAVLIGFVGVGLGAAKLSALTFRHPLAIVLSGLTAIALSFHDEGLQGVHRWVRLGPLRLHPAAIVEPLYLLALAVLWQERKTAVALMGLVMGLALHIAQPDAGQATALALAAIALAAIPDERKSARFVLLILAALGLIGAWMRPDPLTGVPMVEEIVSHAFARSWALGIMSLVVLAMLPLTAMNLARHCRKNQRSWFYGWMLTAYFVACIGVVAIGEFPTPVLGFGASPILGAILGMGLLASSKELEIADRA